MSFIYDEMAVIFMGGFIVLAAKKCNIYPIPFWQEILGMLLGLGAVWLLQKYCGWFSHITFTEQVRLVLIGYLPMRILRWEKKDKKE